MWMISIAKYNRFHVGLFQFAVFQLLLFIAGLPHTQNARGTEPHTHGIWSTSFHLVVTWLTKRRYTSTVYKGGVGETIKREGGVSQVCHGKSTSCILDMHKMINWQLSKQDSHWAVSHDHIVGSCVNSSRWRDYLEAVRWPVNCFTRSRSMFNLIHSSYFESTGKLIMHTSIGHQCCDQLTAVKTGYMLTSISLPYRRLRCWPIEVKYFFEVIHWQVTSFQMITGSSLIFFKFIWNMSCISAAQLEFWFQVDLGRKNSASYYRQGRQLLLTLLTMITHWSCSSSMFYAVIGQNLVSSCRKFMQHLESCLLWQLKLTEFCVNLWCF